MVFSYGERLFFDLVESAQKQKTKRSDTLSRIQHIENELRVAESILEKLSQDVLDIHTRIAMQKKITSLKQRLQDMKLS